MDEFQLNRLCGGFTSFWVHEHENLKKNGIIWKQSFLREEGKNYELFENK